jgi:hypothetical protein
MRRLRVEKLGLQHLSSAIRLNAERTLRSSSALHSSATTGSPPSLPQRSRTPAVFFKQDREGDESVAGLVSWKDHSHSIVAGGLPLMS